MDCQSSQSLLPLWVGQDLPDAAAEQQLRAHVAVCPACRALKERLSSSRRALQRSRSVEAVRPGRIWPRVAAQLAAWEARPQFARFNVWVPTLTAAVACMLLVAVAAVEVQRKAAHWMGGAVAERAAPPRNLFVSDPTFARSRGKFPTWEDAQRWRENSNKEVALPTRYRLQEIDRSRNAGGIDQ